MDTQPLHTPSAFEPEAALPHLSRRPLLCSVLFADLVGSSLRPDEQQVQDKHAFNARIAAALRGTPEERRLALDAGDGVAICFAQEAPAALRVATRLQALLNDAAHPLPARLGLHFGPVRVVRDVNGRPNVVGDGINVARRIMDFAQAGQLLASDAFCRAAAADPRAAAATFRFIGPRADKHGRLHQLHAVRMPAPPAAAKPASTSATIPVRRMIGHSRPFSRDQLARLEDLLCEHIGPIGRIVLRQQVSLGLDAQDLVDALAREIPAQRHREAFSRAAHQELLPEPASVY